MIEDEPEYLFVLKTLKHSILGTCFSKAEKDSIPSFDERILIKIIKKNRVAGFFIKKLQEECLLEGLSRKTQRTLNKGLEACVKNFVQRVSMYETLRAMAADEQIAIIPIKGVALAKLVYQKMPFRTMADIDIFIQEKDEKRFNELLFENGFSKPHSLFRNRWQGGIIRQTHYPGELNNIGRYPLKREQFHVDLHIKPNYTVCGEAISLDTHMKQQSPCR